ncbi:MAG TPA: tetratricopeptide repeat protein [Gammaproteobacteria bacterium]|nr:tetratricopeptide repeat protein [Gammaproteobacteria bacterium]
MRNSALSPLGIAVCILFFISGATGLVYEVVWTRFFTIAYGNTTLGVSAVLTAFMAGLGFGSYVIGRIIDRKRDYLLIYALLEVGIAVAAFVMPALLSSVQGFYSSVYNWFPDSVWVLQVVRTLISFAILIVPTFLMGATLPVLTKFFVSHTSQVGTRIAVLYGVNTLGATVGSFLTGFFLIKLFGLLDTVYIAAAGNLFLAATFLILRRLMSGGGPEVGQTQPIAGDSQEDQGQREVLTPTLVKVLLVCFAFAGYTSLAYEVLWFRLLVFELQTTIYAFTAMLATFLAGIAIGSSVFAVILKKDRGLTRNWLYFGYMEAAIGLFGLLSIMMFGTLETVGLVAVTSFWENVGVQFMLAALIMLPPTFLMGAAFPIVCRILAQDVHSIGGSVGKVYAANTVGAIFGSFLTGFFLVQSIGTQNSIILTAMLNLVIASILLLYAPQGTGEASTSLRRQGGASAGVVFGLWLVAGAGIYAIPGDYLFQYYNIGEKRHDSNVEILYAEEGLETITTVHRYPDGTRVLSTGSINVAGTSFTLRTTQMMQGHVPMLLKPDARRVLQVGFGSGETAHIITTYDNVERLDLVDISQSVLDTSAKYFRDINKDVVRDEKFHPIIMDGANYMRLTHNKYDVIMNDSIWPFYAGNSGLYTRDYFEAGKKRLNKGGIMTSWLPIEIDPKDFEILINTFHSVFPHVTVWIALTHYNKHALLVGSEEKIEIDVEKFLERFNRYAREDLRLVKLDNPVNLLDSFRMDETDFADAVSKDAIHTENNPILEFSPSRGKMAGNEFRVYQFIHEHMGNVLPYLVNVPVASSGGEDFTKNLSAAREASAHVMSGLIKRESYEEDFSLEFEQALAIWPQHPGARRLIEKVQRPVVVTKQMLAGRTFEDLSVFGRYFLKNAAYENASAIFDKMAQLRPDNAVVHDLRGRTLLKLARYNEGIAALNKAAALDPGSRNVALLAMAHNLYGIALGKQNKVDEAEKQFVEALRLSADKAVIHSNYGTLLAKTGRNEEAAIQFKEAIGLAPDDADAYDKLGVILGRSGKVVASVEYLEKAVALQPEHWLAREHLAYAYYYKKDYAKAWRQMHRMQSAGRNINPKFLKALNAAMPDPGG